MVLTLGLPCSTKADIETTQTYSPTTGQSDDRTISAAGEIGELIGEPLAFVTDGASGAGQTEFNWLLLIFVVTLIIALAIELRRHRAFVDLDALERRFTGSVGQYCVRIPVTWRSGLRIRRSGIMLVDETEVVLASSKSIKRWPIWHSGTIQIPRPVAVRRFWLRGLYDDRSSLVVPAPPYVAEAEVAMEKLGWRVTGWRASRPESANDE